MDVGQLGLDLVGPLEQGQDGGQRGPVVGGLDAALLLDVRADAVDGLGAGVEQALDGRPELGVGGVDQGVHHGDAREVGVAFGEPARERTAHRQADHGHVVTAGGQGLEVGLGGTGPVVPAGRDHVLEGGAVPGQQGQLDREPGRGQGLGQGTHGLGVAGEAVQHEDAVGAPWRGPRLGALQDGSGHGGDAIGPREVAPAPSALPAGAPAGG